MVRTAVHLLVRSRATFNLRCRRNRCAFMLPATRVRTLSDAALRSLQCRSRQISSSSTRTAIRATPDSRPVYESGYPAITPDVLQPLPSSQAPVRFLAEVFSNLFQLPELRGVSWNTLDTQVRYGSPSAQSQVSLGSPLYHRSHAMVQCEVKIPNRAHRPARSWMTAGDTGIA